MSSRGEIATKAIVLLVIHLIIATLVILFIAKGIYTLFDKSDYPSDRHELKRFVQLVNNFAEGDETTTKTFLSNQPRTLFVSFDKFEPLRSFEPAGKAPTICAYKIDYKFEWKFGFIPTGGHQEIHFINCEPLDHPIYMTNTLDAGHWLNSYPAGKRPLYTELYNNNDLTDGHSFLVKLEKRQTGSGLDILATLSR